MKAVQLFLTELASLFKKKGVLVSVIVALLVPVVYAAIILSPKWGPYDNVDNLPVAVVNNDRGALSNGEQLNIGEDLIADLKSNRSLGWDFVSSDEANKGLEDLKYYMVIEVPENFSENITTVLDENPQKAELKYIRNEGLHFMAAQVTDKAIETIKTQLSTKITETYVKNVFSQLGAVTDGFETAADGSEQIYDGSVKLKDGTTQILESLTEKSGDIAKLADGAKQLESGTGEIMTNLTSKQGDIAKLADGAKELNAGTGQLVRNLEGKSGDIAKLAKGAKDLNAGANKLNAGANQVLDGLKNAQAGSKQLHDGLKQKLSPGSEELAAGVERAKAGVEETIQTITGLYGALKTLPAMTPEIAQNPVYNVILEQLEQSLAESDQKVADFARLVAGANQIKDGLAIGGEFQAGLANLEGGLDQLVAGQTELAKGAKDLAAGSAQIKDGNATVAAGWNELAKGANQLHSGASQISDGNSTVKEGWKALSAGSTELHNGMKQVSEGNTTVKEGWNTLTDGVSQVDEGLGDLSAGSNELATGLKEGAESTKQLSPSAENMAMFASPVELDGEVINSFPFYRDSNAPYILTLALFAGIVAMSFVLPFRRTELPAASGVSLFTGKVMKLSLLAVAQAVVVSLFALLFIQIDVQSSIMFLLFSIIVSLTFLMIILFLVALAGDVGRFLALAFVVIQLSTTGSSLPVAMLPENLRNLSVYLPFTYSIDGFKNIITLGNFSFVTSDIFVLLAYLVGAALLALVVFIMRYKSSTNIEAIEDAS